MKIIQSYNTFHINGVIDSDRAKCGYSTLRGMLDDFKEFYNINSKHGEYKLYTDIAGKELVGGFVKPEHIEVVEFPIIDDRNPYLGKLYVHSLQDKPYIHVDIDAYIKEMPETYADIITEKYRPCTFRKELTVMKLKMVNESTGKHLRKIICSGLLGFNDIDFKNLYINKAIEKAEWAKENVRALDFPCMVATEEYTLTELSVNNNKLIYELPSGSYVHKQGKVK